MRYLLIGGAGFVGKNLIEHLAGQGHTVVGADKIKQPDHPIFKSCSRYLWRRCAGITQSDLVGVDVVVHLASKTDYHPAYGEYIRNNCAELARLMELDLSGIKRFVLVSSQTVYGWASQPYRTYRTEEKELEPFEHYGLSKLVQERIVTMCCKAPFHIVRPTIILGPHQDGRNLYAGIIKNTVARLHAGLAPMIYGDGEQQRCFVSVHDLCRWIEIPASPLVNATSSEGPVSINELVERIQGLMGTDVEPRRGEFIRTVDERGPRDQVSACEEPDLFGSAATGPVLSEYVGSLLNSPLPSREEIERIDAENLASGVIRRVGK